MADLPMVKAHDSVGEYRLALDPINLFLQDDEQQAIPLIFYLPELLVVVCSALD